MGERYIEKDEDVYAVFVDLEKAFDRVDWKKFAGILKKIGVEGSRGRGRPRIDWDGYMEKIVNKKGKTFREAKQLTRDRAKYRKWINRLRKPDARKGIRERKRRRRRRRRIKS